MTTIRKHDSLKQNGTVCSDVRKKKKKTTTQDPSSFAAAVVETGWAITTSWMTRRLTRSQSSWSLLTSQDHWLGKPNRLLSESSTFLLLDSANVTLLLAPTSWPRQSSSLGGSPRPLEYKKNYPCHHHSHGTESPRMAENISLHGEADCN